jgi:hypothetical protein
MRTVIQTTAANFVPVNGQGRLVMVGVADLRDYLPLRLRLDERHPQRALANRKAEENRLGPAPAGTIRPLATRASRLWAGSSCLRPTRPCRPHRSGHSG